MSGPNFKTAIREQPINKQAVIQRDPKGLYIKTLAGEIDNFIGVSSCKSGSGSGDRKSLR
ncbi:MAG: adenylyl-sulfate kinase [Candidatus Omnitrophota bacterium]